MWKELIWVELFRIKSSAGEIVQQQIKTTRDNPISKLLNPHPTTHFLIRLAQTTCSDDAHFAFFPRILFNRVKAPLREDVAWL